MKSLAPIVAAMAWASAAGAASTPATLPLRDVTVVYRTEGLAKDAIPGGIPGAVRIAWNAVQQKLRVQPDGRSQILLVDLAARRVELLDPAMHGAIDLPVRPNDLDPIRLQDAKLSQSGRAVIAGLPCTEYAVKSSRGQGTICLTDDGVALAGAGDVDRRHGSFTAVSVSYAKLPPSLFEIPPDYTKLAIPGLSRVR